MGLKWIRVLCILIGLLVALLGCGKDGRPGNSYLGVWVEFTEADEIYDIGCPALPGYFYYGFTEYGMPVTDTEYYPQQEGSWPYYYELRWWDSALSTWHYSTTWYGTFSIEVDPGTKGKLLFKDGVDGADRYYDWILGWYGSTIQYSGTQPALTAAPAHDSFSRSAMKARIKSPQQTMAPPDPARYDIGPTRVVTRSDGIYRITITEYPCSPKGAPPALPKSSVLRAAK